MVPISEFRCIKVKIDKSNGGIISPSVMCADLLNLEHDISELKQLGVNLLHVDFMDNRFVPNITFGTDIVRKLKNICSMVRDIHIMGYDPEQYFDLMDIGENDMVSVHFEECDDVDAVLKEIRARGSLSSLAISPDTPVEEIENHLDNIDAVLLMSVYPGFAGKPMAPGSFERLKKVRNIIDNSGHDILLEVDGNVSWKNAPIMRECGADMFVAGSSSIFGKDGSLEDNIKRFRELIK